MRQRWERLTFLHWPFEPGDVQRLLPAGLTAETFDGAAWVGLVPFFMRVATPDGRRVPWVSNFCETNVRTYVRDGEGRSGIWFFSLDAARLGAVVIARTTPYRLPYFWASMRLGARGSRVTYLSRRRWPGAQSPARSPAGSGSPSATPFPRRRSASASTSSPRAGCCSASPAAGRCPPAPVTSPGRCNAPRPRSWTTPSSPPPACPPRREPRWCTTHRASTSPSAAQNQSAPTIGAPPKAHRP